MLNLVLIIGIVAAILMILIVLIQNPKGGGLASNFSSSNQIFGVKRTSEGVEKLTWIFAVVILAVSLLSSMQKGSGKAGAAKVNPEIQKLMDKSGKK